MAEAAAAFYAVETLVEGAAVGAIAVSKSTTPLHIRFRKLAALPSTPPWNCSTGMTVDVVKGRAYVFGGDAESAPEGVMKIVTLPTDIENGEPDYQIVQPDIEPIRPLQQFAASSSLHVRSEEFEGVDMSANASQNSQQISSRTSHASTSIDSKIFVLAGAKPQTIDQQTQGSSNSAAQLFDCDQIYSFSTQTNKWSSLEVDVQNCKSGIPTPRTGATCTSTPHPQPDSAVNITIESYGTIFLHGGYDAHGKALRDIWAFDVSSKIWTRWPDIPDPLAEEIAGEGRITCIGKRLWRVGDGFGKMMYVDFDTVHADVVSKDSGPHHQEVGIKPHDNKWEILSFGDKAANSALLGEIGAGIEKPLVDKTEDLPVPRQGAGFISVTVGAGRTFLLYFMGQDGPGSVLGDIWSFQVQSEQRTAAAAKDIIRNALGKDTGENKWVRCEVIESTKNEGQVFPPRGLAGFAADNWKDLGGANVLTWGGVDASGQTKQQSWIMSVV